MNQHFSNHHNPLGLAFLILSVLASSVFAAGDDATVLQQQAIARIEAAIEYFRKTGDSRAPIADLRQAESELTTSNQAFMVRGDWSAVAHGLVRLGQIQQVQTNWKSTLSYYRQAEEMARRANDTTMQVKALTGVAKTEAALRDYGSAAAHADEAVRLGKRLENKKLLFEALSVVGQIQLIQGDLNAAVDALNRAFSVADGLDEPSLLYGYLDRAEIYYRRAGKCTTQQDYAKNEAFKTCLDAINRARADYNTALNLARKMSYAGLAKIAESFLEELKGQESIIRWKCYNYQQPSQEKIEERKKRCDSQQPSQQKTKEQESVIEQHQGNHQKPYQALFSDLKQYDKFNKIFVNEEFVYSVEVPPIMDMFFRQTQEFRQKMGAENVAPVSWLSLMGQMQQNKGDHDGALKSFLQAVELLEQDRGKLRDERDRGTFLEDKVDVYYYAIRQLLQRRRHAEAFELLERSLSRVMADLLASRPLDLRSQERNLYGEALNLKSQIAKLQSKLHGEISDQKSAAKTSTEIDDLESKYQSVLARIAKNAPRLNQLLVSKEVMPLDSLQQSMRQENYEVLQYLVLEQGVILWHISANAVHVLHVLLPRPQLIEKVAQLRKNLEDKNESFTQDARELFLLLVQPMKQWLKSDRLVIIPHGDLHQVPFQVLQDPANGSFLGERYALSYAPSATVLLGLKKAVAVAGGTLLAIADPTMTEAQDEVEAIAKLYPQRAKVMKESLAKEADIKAWVGDYGIVHLSVHGKFNGTEPLLSHLKFGRSGQDDGDLTAAEMFGLPLDKARLLVLSACEIGKVEATRGNEVPGMMQALIYAGAGSLVLSYWRVEAKSTALWMEAFYRAAQSVPPAEAARQALQAVKNRPEYTHPYFWAAFMTVSR